MKSDKSFILCINENKLLKKYTMILLNQCKYKDTIFMNSENSQNSKPYVLILKLTENVRLKKR